MPDERLAEERSVLAALPSLRLEIGAGSVRRKVDGCRASGTARPATRCPHRLVGATVAVVVDHGALIMLEPATGVIVAEHELVGPGEVSILDEHYDGPRPAPSRGPRPKTQAEKQFCALGAEAEQFLVGAAAIGNTRLESELDILLGLGAAHGEQAWSTRCAGRWRFDGSAPPTCAPSWPPAPAPHNPAPPAMPWSWICPPPRPGPWTPTRSPAHRRRDGVMTATTPKPVAPTSVAPLAADLDAALRRLKLATVRRNAAEVLQVAKTATLDPRGDPAHLGRGRDRRPGCLQHRQPPQGRRVPGHQDPRRVRRDRLIGHPGHVRLPVESGMDSGTTESGGHRSARAPARVTCSSAAGTPPCTPVSRSATSPPPT